MAPTTAKKPVSVDTINALVSTLATMPPASLSNETVIAGALYGGFSDNDAIIMTAIASVTTGRNALAVSGQVNDLGDRRYGVFAAQLSPADAIDGQWMSPGVSGQQALAEYKITGFPVWGAYLSGAYVAGILQAQMALISVRKKYPGKIGDAELQALVTADKSAAQAIVQGYGAWIGGAVGGTVLAPAVGAGTDAIGQLGAATAGATNDAVFKPFGSVLDFLNALGNPQTWVRVATALVGGALIVVALRQVVMK